MAVEFKFKDRDNWNIYYLSKASELEALSHRIDLKLENDFTSLNLDLDKIYFVEFEGLLGFKHTDFEGLLPVTLSKTPKSSDYKTEPLLKALSKNKGKKIIDITGGLLGDALRIYKEGFELSVYEENPIIQVLIEYEMKKKNWSFEFFNKGFKWDELAGLNNFAVFYDPFFRKEKVKSPPKGSMQVLKEIDLGSENLERPLDHDFPIYVKRPIKAKDLWEKPHSRYLGKNIRYDLYV